VFSIEQQNIDGACRIAVSGEMTIYSAAELKDKLLTAAAGGPIELDLGAVSECDSAGVQLLALLKRTAADGGMRIVEASDAVRELLDLYRLAGEMNAVAASAPGTGARATDTGRHS